MLDDREIAALVTALDADPLGPLVKVMLLTGARRSEVSEMKWPEVDLAAKVWRLPRARSKNGREHTLPLPDDVVDILAKLRRIEASDLVFTTNGLNAFTSFDRAKKRLHAAMEKTLDEAVPNWALHDLSRTCASGMASLKISLHVVEAVLNHKSGTVRGVAAVYNRYSYQPEMRAALEAWARRVREIKTGETASNVVDFRPAVNERS